MEELPKKSIMDRFQEHLHSNFETFCNRHGIEQTQGQFITFIIDQNLIERSLIQRYTVLKEYEKICAEHQYTKTLIVEVLSNRFHISTRTVWSILKYVKTDNK